MQCPICETEVAPNDVLCRACGAALAHGEKTSTTSSLLIGTKLDNGHFSIGRVLGKGGFGITYLGSDLQLRRSVAIKELYPSGCQRVDSAVQPAGNWPPARFQQAKEKFLKEAQTLAQFQHPNICYVHMSFEENDTAYMVMEYIKGSTLYHILKEHGPFDEQNATNCILQLCEALQTIHKSNVLHRDIKPGNILLADDGRIVLIDFGTAREFAAETIKHMTLVLTPGYAPIEQYTREGKLGPYTDIYAAGATLYHLLTGMQPIAATDQANGAVLVPPRQLNPAVSPTISDAVMWAMQLKAESRPQTVEEFLSGLSGRSKGPVSRFTQGFDRSLESTSPGENPYKDRIEAILAELEAGTPAPPASTHDEEINSVTAVLTALGKTRIGSFPTCPCCGQKTMVEATGESGKDTCPVCKGAQLNRREQILRRCPVCREGALENQTVDASSTICPVCRASKMQNVKRKKFGLSIDEWLVCSDCHAEMNVVLGGQAKLVRYQKDPFGVGKKHSEHSLPLADWRKMVGRSEKFLECGHCRAQFDAGKEKSLTLVLTGSDPHGTGRKYKNVSLPRNAWANIADGLEPSAGNAKCPACEAEFAIDNDRQEIAVLKSDDIKYPWSKNMWGKGFPLRIWYLSEAGKRSMFPGWVCSHCKTEFDKIEKNLKLVWTISGPLAGMEGQTHTVEGWHRIAVGLPTKTEEARLRDRLTRLHILKQEELDHYYQEEAKYQAGLKTELDELIRKAFVAGCVPILLKHARIFLLDNETLYWESPAKRHQRTMLSGAKAWSLESRGVLVLTNQRIIYDNRHVIWQHALDDIVQIELEDGTVGGLVVVTMAGYPAPIGFELREAQFTVTTEFSNHTIHANPRDMVLLTMAIKERESGVEAPAQ